MKKEISKERMTEADSKSMMEKMKWVESPKDCGGNLDFVVEAVPM